MTDPMELVRRLESNAPLPICPYDRRSPEYWTTNDTDPCRFCGTKNEEGAPDLCRGADTRLFTEAAACIREMVEWRPMFEAPKDRTPILARIYDDLFPRVVGEARDDLERWNGQRVVVHHPGLCEDGYDLGWSVSAPVGFGIGRDDWFSGWLPLPPAPGAEA